MSQQIEGPRKTFTAGTALEAFRRVKITAATGAHGPTVGYAGASDPCIGVTETYEVSGAPVAICLANAQGTRKMSATAAAITANNPVYAAANGQIAATGTIVEGKALETTAGAAGDILEVLPVHNSDISTALTGTTGATFEADSDVGKPRAALGSQTGGTGDFKAVIRPPATLTADRVFTLVGDAAANIVNEATAQTLTNKTLTSPVINTPTIKRTVEAHTGDDTLTAAETDTTHTNAGASGAVTLTLPAAVAGLQFTFHVQAAQELRIDPDGTETIALPSTGAQGAAGKYLTANAAGEWAKLVCVEAGTWDVEGYAGTWTAEA